MNEINDGGPAFPCSTPHSSEGLSLRDYFAVHAMQGLVHDILIDQHWEDVLKQQDVAPEAFPEFLAHLSYVTADAMLAARDRKDGAP